MSDNLRITKGILLNPVLDKILTVSKMLDGNLESMTLEKIKRCHSILSRARKDLKLVYKCLSSVESNKSDGDP